MVNSMFLKKVAINNFMSLRHVEVDLSKINVLIGPNATGKSNFIRALHFLSLLGYGDLSWVLQSMGFKSFSDIVYGQVSPLEVSLSLEVEGDDGSYFYGICLHNGRVVKEELKFNDVILVSRIDPYKARYLTARGDVVIDTCSTGRLAIFSLGNVHERVKSFAKYVRSWSFYSFNPEAITLENTVAYSRRLSRDGGNLAQVLHTLLTAHRREFKMVEYLMKACIPSIEEVLTPPSTEQGKIYVAIRERGFDKYFSFNQISNGTLRLLAFITALSLDSQLIGFEEPENCIHPHLLETLMDVIEKSGKQVIITTHSPHLLDHVELESILLVRKVDGETRIKKLSQSEQVEYVRKFLLEGGTLGEAWYSGVMHRG